MGRVIQSLSETVDLWFRCSEGDYEAEGDDAARAARNHVRRNPTHAVTVRRASKSVISWEE